MHVRSLPQPIALTVAALAFAALLPPQVRAQDAAGGSLAAKVEEIFQRMQQAQGPGLWDHSLALQELGAGAAGEVARRLDSAPPASKVAAAKAILAGDAADTHRGAAITALKEVIRAGTSRELGVRAADLLTAYGLRTEVRPLMRDVDQIHDPFVKIHLLRALRVQGRFPQAERKLREYLTSDDFAVQCEAALVLASPEIGNVAVAKPILSKLKNEPTDRGRQARAYLEMDDMLSQLEKYAGLEDRDDLLKARDREIAHLKGEIAKIQAQMRAGSGGAAAADVPGGELLKELVERVRTMYVDEDKAKVEELIDAAAAGLVDSLDPFSSYMNEKAVNEFNRSIQQRYGGIGAVVQMDRKTGFLSIQRPIYGNPAHKAGLRSLDQVTEVEGTSTKGKTVQELVQILKGPEGTPVKVKVQPFFGGDEREVEITRAQITLKSVRWDMLPGDIGYIQLSQFGHLATLEVEEALRDLESRGMKGLILDLRGNPGGLLSAAVEIADKFLEDDQLVVYSEGRKGTRYGARQEDGGPSVRRRRLQQPKHPDYPLVVLIDEHSASASEIVSGALQAHERAELVGNTTFGKGSVQNIFPLESMGDKAALRMTIAYYYLPDGRLIHRSRHVESWRFREQVRSEIGRWQQEGLINETQAKELLDQYAAEPGGVEPDYKVEQTQFTAAQTRAFGLILDLDLLEQYIRDYWTKHKDLFHTLARFDHFEPKRYPDFEALWAKVQESLDQASKKAMTENDLRILLRSWVRRFTQDDLARELTSDYQEDRQLQAALLLIAEKTGQDIGKLGQLAFIANNFPDGVAHTRKPEEEKKGEEEQAEGRDFK